MNKVTIDDIASIAGVSKSTVSRVLNGTATVHPAKTQAVMDATKRLGFKPSTVARSLASGRSLTVGVLTQLIGSPFYDAIAQGVIQRLSGTGYSPIFIDGQWQREQEIDGIGALVGRQVDGLVLIGGDVTDREIADTCGQLPTVVVARQLATSDHHCIWTDNVDGGYQATRHLIEKGHRRIAIIRGQPHHPDTGDRFQGYQNALREYGISVDQSLILDGDFSSESGLRCAEQLLESTDDVTAIFAMNDMMAFGARLALHRGGVGVPEDVSLVGFDDQMESAFMTPPLTTVSQPARRMGEAAASSVLAMINGEAVTAGGVRVELVERESVKKLSSA